MGGRRGRSRWLSDVPPRDGPLATLVPLDYNQDIMAKPLCEGIESEKSALAGKLLAWFTPVTAVEHGYSHFRITLHAFHCRLVTGEPRAIGCADWRWVHLSEISRFPFPVADQRIITALISSPSSPEHGPEQPCGEGEEETRHGQLDRGRADLKETG